MPPGGRLAGRPATPCVRARPVIAAAGPLSGPARIATRRSDEALASTAVVAVSASCVLSMAASGCSSGFATVRRLATLFHVARPPRSLSLSGRVDGPVHVASRRSSRYKGRCCRASCALRRRCNQDFFPFTCALTSPFFFSSFPLAFFPCLLVFFPWDAVRSGTLLPLLLPCNCLII